MVHVLRSLGIGIALAAACLRAQERIDPAQFDAAVAWFDTLGYPRVADLPFVRIATGWTSTSRSGAENTYLAGFLLREDGRRFTVLTLGLATREFSSSPADTPEHARIGHAAESLREFAKSYPSLENDHRLQEPPFVAGFGEPRPSRACVTFVLAWACQQCGERELALDLATEARARYGNYPGTLTELLARDVAHVTLWRLVLAFGDPARSCPQLLADCERFVHDFPGVGDDAARGKEMQAVLARMVREQAARPPLPADASEAERIGELVFRLREQNGRQSGQPGSCDVFDDPRGEQSPAHQLVALGYRALPHLVRAYDDDSFTRSVGFHRDFYFSHEILRVRDVAREIASRITGSWLATREEAERALAEWQQRGERGVLIDGAERGNVEHARRLLERFPADVVPAARKALGGDLDGSIRSQWLLLVGGVPGEEATELLTAELRRDGGILPRVTAATQLFARARRDEAIDAMVALWRRPLLDYDAEIVGRFLATCGAVRAVRALGERREELDYRVLFALGAGAEAHPYDPLPDAAAVGRGEDGLEAAIEDLLGSLLGSARVHEVMYNGIIDPSTAEFAGAALHRRWPDRYPFDFYAPRPIRWRQLRLLQNAWRQRQGLAPLPEPPAPGIPAVDPAKVELLLLRAEAERAEGPRRAFLDEIEVLGLGALPALDKHAIPPTAALASAELQALRSRVASHVREVQVREGRAPLQAGLRAKAEALAGKRLDPGALVGVLCAFAEGDATAPAFGAVQILRAGDGTGVVVEFAFGSVARTDYSVDFAAQVNLGVDNLYDCHGCGGGDSVDEAGDYRAFVEALEKARLGAPDLPFDARYEIRFH